MMAGRPLEDEPPATLRIGVVDAAVRAAPTPDVAGACEAAIARAARAARAGRDPAARGDRRRSRSSSCSPRRRRRTGRWLRTRLADYGARRPGAAARRALLAVDRLRDRPPRPPLGAAGVRTRARRIRPARRARDADHGAAARRDPARLPAALMPYNSPAALLGLPVTSRAVRLRRRAPGRARAHGPPRRGRCPARRRRRVPAGRPTGTSARRLTQRRPRGSCIQPNKFSLEGGNARCPC